MPREITPTYNPNINMSNTTFYKIVPNEQEEVEGIIMRLKELGFTNIVLRKTKDSVQVSYILQSYSEDDYF